MRATAGPDAQEVRTMTGPDDRSGAGKSAFAVAVLGASAKVDRYSYKAVRMLRSLGYEVYPVHPAVSEIEGLRVYRSLTEIGVPVDTITVYLSPKRSEGQREEILRSAPRRVIFNPGAENPVLAGALTRAGIEVLNACTLVMLTTGQFGPKEPIRTCAECVPCVVRQASEAIALSRPSPGTEEPLFREVLGYLASADWNVSPPVLSQMVQRLLRERTGCVDPYQKMKASLNRAAAEVLPQLAERVPVGMDPREAAVRMAISGNILDAGAKSGLKIEEALAAMQDLFQRPLDGDWSGLFDAAEQAGSILYLADNAGEIVFDRALIERLPRGKVTVAVRGGAVLNDATLEDARAAGLNEVAVLISNGSDAPGTLLEDCAPAFRELFQNSGLIISKGQGNYETLSSVDGPIVFLFQVKCQAIALRAGAAVGTMVIRKDRG